MFPLINDSAASIIFPRFSQSLAEILTARVSPYFGFGRENMIFFSAPLFIARSAASLKVSRVYLSSFFFPNDNFLSVLSLMRLRFSLWQYTTIIAISTVISAITPFCFAPLESGALVGELEYRLHGETIGVSSVRTANAVGERPLRNGPLVWFGRYFQLLFTKLIF